MKNSLQKKKKTCIRQTSYTLNKTQGKKREKHLSWMKDSLTRKKKDMCGGGGKGESQTFGWFP